MALPRASPIIMYKKGERGSPCLIPLEEEKKLDGFPLINIENLGVEMHSNIQFIHCLSNPKACMILQRKHQSTLSYAFVISSFIIIPGLFVLWRVCIASCATITLSRIDRPGTNPVYSSEMMLFMRGFILLVMIFERIL